MAVSTVSATFDVDAGPVPRRDEKIMSFSTCAMSPCCASVAILSLSCGFRVSVRGAKGARMCSPVLDSFRERTLLPLLAVLLLQCAISISKDAEWRAVRTLMTAFSSMRTGCGGRVLGIEVWALVSFWCRSASWFAAYARFYDVRMRRCPMARWRANARR